MGRGITAGDSKALAAIAWLRAYRPGWEPRNILDMGCAAGGASTVYPAHFPHAEVHAVDLGASMLRYAHARAESIGVPVHFHQRSEEHTSELQSLMRSSSAVFCLKKKNSSNYCASSKQSHD